MTDLISRADAIEAVMKHKMPFTIQQEVAREIDALPSADVIKVAYICDGRKCDKDCSECFRTLDIEHARDFKKMGGTYYQQESADAAQGEWLYVENEPYSECSKCGRYIDDLDEDKYAYCPYCGAKMKGGTE